MGKRARESIHDFDFLESAGKLHPSRAADCSDPARQSLHQLDRPCQHKVFLSHSTCPVTHYGSALPRSTIDSRILAELFSSALDASVPDWGGLLSRSCLGSVAHAIRPAN